MLLFIEATSNNIGMKISTAEVEYLLKFSSNPQQRRISQQDFFNFYTKTPWFIFIIFEIGLNTLAKMLIKVDAFAVCEGIHSIQVISEDIGGELSRVPPKCPRTCSRNILWPSISSPDATLLRLSPPHLRRYSLLHVFHFATLLEIPE